MDVFTLDDPTLDKLRTQFIRDKYVAPVAADPDADPPVVAVDESWLSRYNEAFRKNFIEDGPIQDLCDRIVTDQTETLDQIYWDKYYELVADGKSNTVADAGAIAYRLDLILRAITAEVRKQMLEDTFFTSTLETGLGMAVQTSKDWKALIQRDQNIVRSRGGRIAMIPTERY